MLDSAIAYQRFGFVDGIEHPEHSDSRGDKPKLNCGSPPPPRGESQHVLNSEGKSTGAHSCRSSPGESSSILETHLWAPGIRASVRHLQFERVYQGWPTCHPQWTHPRGCLKFTGAQHPRTSSPKKVHDTKPKHQAPNHGAYLYCTCTRLPANRTERP